MLLGDRKGLKSAAEERREEGRQHRKHPSDGGQRMVLPQPFKSLLAHSNGRVRIRPRWLLHHAGLRKGDSFTVKERQQFHTSLQDKVRKLAVDC